MEKGDKGDTESKSEQGDTGEKGDTGPQGAKGEKGDNGETPVITVVEDTPLTYKLNFKTSADDITTPNLFKSLDEYHVDLSASGSTLNIPLESLILTYQQISTTALHHNSRKRYECPCPYRHPQNHHFQYFFH